MYVCMYVCVGVYIYIYIFIIIIIIIIIYIPTLLFNYCCCHTYSYRIVTVEKWTQTLEL